MALLNVIRTNWLFFEYGSSFMSLLSFCSLLSLYPSIPLPLTLNSSEEFKIAGTNIVFWVCAVIFVYSFGKNIFFPNTGAVTTSIIVSSEMGRLVRLAYQPLFGTYTKFEIEWSSNCSLFSEQSFQQIQLPSTVGLWREKTLLPARVKV